MIPQRVAPSRSNAPRGQTGVDFIVGVAVFLITVAFVFSFVPGMLAPFGESTNTPIYADRIADELVYGTLAEDGAQPGVLNRTRTDAFFANSGSNGPDIDGVPVYYTVNVTLETIGPGYANRTDPVAPTEYGSVSVVTRHVLLDDQEGILVVRVW